MKRLCIALLVCVATIAIADDLLLDLLAVARIRGRVEEPAPTADDSMLLFDYRFTNETECVGGFYRDASTNLYHGTQTVASKIAAWTNGYLSFDGGDDYFISISGAAAVTTNFTIHARINLRDTNGFSGLFYKGPYFSDQSALIEYGAQFYGRCYFGYKSIDDNQATGIKTPNPVTTGVWVSICGTYNSSGKIARLFLNGVMVTQRTDIVGATDKTTNYPSIGALSYNNRTNFVSHFNGSISHIKVWGRDIASNEAMIAHQGEL
jgi:hypothetical protein